MSYSLHYITAATVNNLCSEQNNTFIHIVLLLKTPDLHFLLHKVAACTSELLHYCTAKHVYTAYKCYVVAMVASFILELYYYKNEVFVK